MGKPIWADGYKSQEEQGSEMSADAQQQASDSYILEAAKEILCKLWKEERLTLMVRAVAEAGLAAALHATEFPGLRKIDLRQGAALSERQWAKAEEAKSREF